MVHFHVHNNAKRQRVCIATLPDGQSPVARPHKPSTGSARVPGTSSRNLKAQWNGSFYGKARLLARAPEPVRLFPRLY